MRFRVFLPLLLNLAFAISCNLPPSFAQAASAGERGERDGSEIQEPAEPGYLGAQLQELDASAVKALGLDQDHAILILFPTAGNPAEKMGLMPGDVIVTFNGTAVPTLAEFLENIKKSGRGTQVTLAIWRRGQSMTFSVPLAAVPQTRPTAVETLELRIAAYSAITTIFTPDAFPTVWGGAQHKLGNAYWKRIRGNHAENLEAAIKAYEAALTVRTREASPKNWAATQNNLGSAYAARIQGGRAENLEVAIKAYEAALTVYTRDGFPQDWATTQDNLGLAYASRIQGSRAENLEVAIKAHEAALTVYTREAFPKDWATTQDNLGLAYANRIQGSRAENLEAAIKAYEAALTVHTREAFPKDWAWNQNLLGLAYTARIQGNREDNIETAIKAYEAALTVYTREVFPEDWARIQNDLGIVYSQCERGFQEENIEAAIKAYEAALTVRTREASPEDWATTQNALAFAYSVRIQGSRAENIEAAIKAYEAALSVRTREAFPRMWASTQSALGFAYFNRIQGSQAENMEAAIKASEAALTIYTREAFPREHLQFSGVVGYLFMLRGDWHRANANFASAIVAFRILFGEGVDKEDARDVITQAGSLFTNAAFVQAHLDNAKSALQMLSEGRAHMLAAALHQKALALSPAQQIQYRALQLEIREWAQLADAKGVEGAEALRHVSEARVKLAALIAEARSRSEKEHGIDVVARQGYLQRGALVAPIVTEVGSKFLIATVEDGKASIRIENHPELTTKALRAVLRSTDPAGENTGWFVDYAKQGRDNKAWLAAVDGIGPKLWTLFAGRLDAELKKAGIADGKRLIVLPEGVLGVLPLDLARDPKSGRSFADAYEIASVPSLEAYLAAARTVGNAQTPSLSETVNTLGDLPYTEIEGALVASYFTGKQSIRLDKANAVPDVVLAGLKGKTYWHFATHGVFDWKDAQQTGLLMKDNARLTVGALFEARAGLGTPRLVVLSACETGLYDADRNPGEFVGLPAAFLQLGAGGVIASLWQVDDLATALLMSKFYDLNFDKGLAPSAALKQAKAWLRNATRRELIAYAKAVSKRAHAQQTQLPDLVAALRTGRRSAGSRFRGIWDVLGLGGGHKSATAKPFAHPYYWSGFVYTGG